MNESGCVVHMCMIGFHHRKGSIIELVYPSFTDCGTNVPNGNVIVPPKWKNLASLALPDGAHNFLSGRCLSTAFLFALDIVYFTLPSLENTRDTVFGIALYRQIAASALPHYNPDVTRNTVQKSLVVLSRLPLFGFIAHHLSVLADALFENGPFTVERFKQFYIELNTNFDAVLKNPPAYQDALHYNLSPANLIRVYGRDALILFKLVLLERRILFTGESAGWMCNWILTLLSLFPNLLENGLSQCAFVDRSWVRDRTCWASSCCAVEAAAFNSDVHTADIYLIPNEHIVTHTPLAETDLSFTSEAPGNAVRHITDIPLHSNQDATAVPITIVPYLNVTLTAFPVRHMQKNVQRLYSKLITTNYARLLMRHLFHPFQRTIGDFHCPYLQSRQLFYHRLLSYFSSHTSAHFQLKRQPQTITFCSPNGHRPHCTTSLSQAMQLTRLDRVFIDQLQKLVTQWFHAQLSAYDLSLPHATASTVNHRWDPLSHSQKSILLRFPSISALNVFVRAQFATYLRASLLTAGGYGMQADDFNSLFIKYLSRTNSFGIWRTRFVPDNILTVSVPMSSSTVSDYITRSRPHEAPTHSSELNLSFSDDLDVRRPLRSLSSTSLPRHNPSRSVGEVTSTLSSTCSMANMLAQHPGRLYGDSDNLDLFIVGVQRIRELATDSGRRFVNRTAQGFTQLGN
ncbi:unnamed protein product [Dicrocoelium dendriticum]|nr:unnamed protein product [Dicrocoelium dendriticum]